MLYFVEKVNLAMECIFLRIYWWCGTFFCRKYAMRRLFIKFFPMNKKGGAAWHSPNH